MGWPVVSKIPVAVRVIRLDHPTAYVTPAASDFAARPFGPELVRRLARAWQLCPRGRGRIRLAAITAITAITAIIAFRAPTPLRPRLRGWAVIGCRRDPLLPYR
jgi:hypothetical protein